MSFVMHQPVFRQDMLVNSSQDWDSLPDKNHMQTNRFNELNKLILCGWLSGLG